MNPRGPMERTMGDETPRDEPRPIPSTEHGPYFGVSDTRRAWRAREREAATTPDPDAPSQVTSRAVVWAVLFGVLTWAAQWLLRQG